MGEKEQKLWFLAANYNAKTDEEKEQIGKMFTRDESNLLQKLNSQNSTLEGETQISIIESSVGLSTIIVFIAIYLGIFFGLPLVLAIIHSIFGIQFAMSIFETLASKEQLLPSIIVTAIVIGIIYGCYFLATYIGSKNIIKDEE